MREVVMKALHHSMIAAMGLALVLPMPANADVNDPEVIIYRFPGVRDDVTTGVATVFHCTNFSGVTESVRLVTRDTDGSLKSNGSVPINHLVTKSFSTHSTNAYVADTNMGTSLAGQGTTAIAATST